MKRISYKSDEERTILTAMIVHNNILGRVYTRLGQEKRPFASAWCNEVARWCFEYYSRYKKAPGKAIEGLFNTYAQKAKDDNTVSLIERLLSSLSNDYKALKREMNEDYLVDLASAHFDRVRMRRLNTSLESDLDNNDVDAARVRLQSFEPVRFGASDWINPSDEDVIRRALSARTDQELIRMPGCLGQFLSPHLERDGFISFAGPEKRGKSFWLLEMAWQALRQRRRVLYYVVGDMSERQVMRRLLKRAARRPLVPMEISKPIRIINKKKETFVESQTKHYTKGLSAKWAIKAMQQVRQKTATKDLRLKLRCVGTSTISAGDIEQDIADLAKVDWPPDVVVIDYADVLSAERHCEGWDYRNQVNETWKTLRRISQQYHLLVVTATQTAATSYGTWVIRKSDFSEDKRKNAHVTGMIGINQTAEEKKEELYRLNWIFLREGAWAENQVVWTAGCLELATPCVISSF